MQLIDSHAHLDFTDFESDLAQVISRARKMGVNKIINIGVDLERSKKAVELSEAHDNIWTTVGVHPEGCEMNLVQTRDEIKRLIASTKKIVAIGECGLDYFHSSNYAKQKEMFQMQVSLAGEQRLPLVIHIRNGENDEAIKDAYNILSKAKGAKGVIHCFTFDSDWANRFTELGFLIGFTGIVTYKNATTIQDTARALPLEKILIETDCPYLAPQRYRGQRNEPAFVLEVAGKIAELKMVDVIKVSKVTSQNAEELFHI